MFNIHNILGRVQILDKNILIVCNCKPTKAYKFIK